MFDQPIQLEVFPTDLHLKRIDLACNMRRFYRLSVQRDLFGGACLIREWGRIGYRGQIMIETHDEGKAITALMKLAAVKRKRDYALPPATVLPKVRKLKQR